MSRIVSLSASKALNELSDLRDVTTRQVAVLANDVPVDLDAGRSRCFGRDLLGGKVSLEDGDLLLRGVVTAGPLRCVEYKGCAAII